MQLNNLIYKTSCDDEVYYLNDSILINFNVKRNGISTSQLNGGSNDLYKSVFNQHLSQDKIDYLESHDICEFLINECKLLDVDFKYSTALITLARMKNLSIVKKSFKGIEVTALTTAGVRTNASKAGDPSSYWEENGEFHFGTINTILLMNVHLENHTLMEAFMTVTEAKTVAMHNLKIPSQYSNGFATGTGTDGVAVFSNIDSKNKITNAGKHSKLGELIANAVIESVVKAIGKQVWITNKSQSNALVRLNRYKLDINKFYDKLDVDKKDFVRQLQRDARNQCNVAITTSILNLFDEVFCNLIDRDIAFELAMDMAKKCRSYPIKKLLEYWINYFIG